VGLIDDAVYHAGRMAGEAKRKRESAERVQTQSTEAHQYVANLIAAAQNGDVQSMYVLGCHYSEGKYVVLDFEQAAHWWQQAAEHGHVWGQYNLGVLYCGDLSPYWRDDNLAGHWFACAARNGLPEAQDAVSEYQLGRFSGKWSKR